MTDNPSAQPVAILLAWTFVIFFWMYATRIPAMIRAGFDIKTMKGTTGRTLDDKLPPEVQWKAHNYNHLLEQPVAFYAACLLLILLDGQGDAAVALAWAYVALRILHSLVQVTINVIRLRFALFALSSLTLIALVILTLLAAF